MGHTCISLLTILLFCLDHFRIRFLVLTLISVLVPMLLATPDRMSRSDGTKVTIPPTPLPEDQDYRSLRDADD